MLTAIVIVLFACVVLVDFRPMSGASAKEKIIYLALMALSFGVLLLYSLDIPVPSPAEGIRNVIDAIFHV
jgi:hypothetical protein